MFPSCFFYKIQRISHWDAIFFSPKQPFVVVQIKSNLKLHRACLVAPSDDVGKLKATINFK